MCIVLFREIVLVITYRKIINMSSFFWHVYGFNKPLKYSVVKKWIGNSEMKFGCILETKVKEKKAEKILNSVFRD